MFEWLGRRRGTKKQEPEKQEMEKQKTSASVRSVLKTAVADAEQIVSSIKMKAQVEAEEEAARIIAQANQEAEEIKGRAETAAEKGTGDILPVASRKTEKPQEDVIEEKVEEPVQLRNEATISEPVAAATEELLEQHLPEKRPDREETEPGLPEQNSHPLYTGEVELTITKPVDPKMVSKLYNYLQTTPEIKLVHTTGSWDRGTTITIVLDKPIPLISVISSKVPEAEATAERPEKDGYVSGKRGVRRIRLALKRG